MKIKVLKSRTADAAAFYCPYIPIQVITLTNKVKFKFKDVGDKRWLCFATVPRSQTSMFEEWMKEFMPNTWVNKAMWDPKHNPYEKPGQVYELRGGDTSDKVMLILKWGSNDE